MKRRLVTILLLCTILYGAMPPVHAADAEIYNAADVLYDLKLFSGTGIKPDGTPNFELDRPPTRQEAVTILVNLLGKQDEARAGTWDIPFTDVANWAKPYVGYAYANGLTAGISATTYGSNNLITASQYLTFVLKALGYETGTDFKWDKAWELSDRLGLTDGRYSATGHTFMRGDLTLISRNALDEELKGSSRTLSEKLISEKVFTKAAYKESAASPLVLGEPELIVPNVAFSMDGRSKLITTNDVRVGAGTYTITPYLRGERFDEFSVKLERGTGTVKKNNNGTFTVDFPAEDNFHIALFYDPEEREFTNPDGSKYTTTFWTKRSLSFNPPIPSEGFVLDRGDRTINPDGGYFGDNFSSYFVMDIYFNGTRLSDYSVTAETGAPFTAHIQADGSLLLKKIGDGSGKFTITYQGQSATFGATMAKGSL